VVKEKSHGPDSDFQVSIDKLLNLLIGIENTQFTEEDQELLLLEILNIQANCSEVLEKQIKIADKLLDAMNQDELVVKVIQRLIDTESWSCKLFIRIMMHLVGKDRKYFKKVIDFFTSMIEKGMFDYLYRQKESPELW
jgi:hypothetical protein